MIKPTVPGLTEERTIPLAEMLSNHGFVDVTGLTEYLFGIIPTRTIGKNMLAKYINSCAIINLPPSMMHNARAQNFEMLDPFMIYLLVVTENSKIWIGKPSVKMINLFCAGNKLDLSEIDIRLTQFTDRHDEAGFKRLVRPHRLRALDLLTRSSPIFK